jgi:eukaryotic-like serine/threonine-protein kinase
MEFLLMLTETTKADSWMLPAGAQIDPSLVIIESLGGGTRYEVFRAWDRQLFCQVAVKVVRPNRVSDDRVIDGFEREIDLSAGLRHPNLVGLLRWTTAAPRPYLVFEYIGARTVGAHLDRARVTIPETCLLGIRVLSALHYLHSKEILHLDVKPDNVTMGDPPRLLDLSLARRFSGSLKLRHTMGTGPYMPPEQCDHGELTPQSDLFALGATLYEAVSGMRPFPPGDEDAPERTARYPQLIEDAYGIENLVEIPPMLARLIMSCLSRDPARRPKSAIHAAVTLQGVLEYLGIRELYAWPKGMSAEPIES